ncbi:hypothetical protein Q2T41_06285 [Maribacter confluentis]|uniref:Uncharacterized protein n=1 Tax=Maribacter confluentis TaxID=1656093 RepID=A0ABT8RMW1_9FLAO|nr:hypothetical protein [Maribacter confluentis]MDO1512260.1 hypothetical protein [Maribacter confluentis]
MNFNILNTKFRLEDDRVLLLPFENERNEELKKIIFVDEIWEFMGMTMNTELEFDNYIANTIKDKANGIYYPFLIIDKK